MKTKGKQQEKKQENICGFSQFSARKLQFEHSTPYTVAAFLMATPIDFNDVNGSMIRKLNSDLFIILNF